MRLERVGYGHRSLALQPGPPGVLQVLQVPPLSIFAFFMTSDQRLERVRIFAGLGRPHAQGCGGQGANRRPSACRGRRACVRGGGDRVLYLG
jgi:hypothetical protein